MLSAAFLLNAREQFMNIQDPLPDLKRDDDGNLTYTRHTKNDAHLVGIITHGVIHRALSDKIHKELGRLSRMAPDHPDIWQQNHQHVILMDILQKECEEDDFHSKKFHTQKLEMAMMSFNGKEITFEKFRDNVYNEIDACERANIVCEDDMLILHFATRFNPQTPSWKLWKEVVMQHVDGERFEDIINKGLIRERSEKLTESMMSYAARTPVAVNFTETKDDVKCVAVNYGGYENNDDIKYDKPRGGSRVDAREH